MMDARGEGGIPALENMQGLLTEGGGPPESPKQAWKGAETSIVSGGNIMRSLRVHGDGEEHKRKRWRQRKQAGSANRDPTCAQMERLGSPKSPPGYFAGCWCCGNAEVSTEGHLSRDHDDFEGPSYRM